LFGFGNNKEGQIGQKDIQKSEKLSPINFFDNKEILDFVCDESSTYVLTSFNFLFFFFFIFF
jgi:hypothetical protein